MILLLIVMVSPGTHLAENHESLPKTNEFQLKKNKESSWKCMGLYVTNWRQMPKLFTKFTEVKIKSFYIIIKAQRRLKYICIFKQQGTEITQTGYFTKTSSNWSIILYVLRDVCHELMFYVFGYFYTSGPGCSNVG